MRVVKPLLICVLVSLSQVSIGAELKPVVSIVDQLPKEVRSVVDTRQTALCETASLPQARCLPADLFLTDRGVLANFSGILWMLGAIGLKGDEHVVVIGDNEADKLFVAGILYIAGQKKISILENFPLSVNNLGQTRSKTREKVFQADPREHTFILPGELRAALAENPNLVITSCNKIIKPSQQGAPAGKTVICHDASQKQAIATLAKLAAKQVNARIVLGTWRPPATPHLLRDKTFRLIVFAALCSLIVFAAAYFFITRTKRKEG